MILRIATVRNTIKVLGAVYVGERTVLYFRCWIGSDDRYCRGVRHHLWLLQRGCSPIAHRFTIPVTATSRPLSATSQPQTDGPMHERDPVSYDSERAQARGTL